jgi:hypothetical protein
MDFNCSQGGKSFGISVAFEQLAFDFKLTDS